MWAGVFGLRRCALRERGEAAQARARFSTLAASRRRLLSHVATFGRQRDTARLPRLLI